MMQFVGVALHVCDKMHIVDKAGQGVVMRFAKIYSPEKIGHIVQRAKQYPWWEKNPKAAFMKAVGEVNKLEKETPTGFNITKNPLGEPLPWEGEIDPNSREGKLVELRKKWFSASPNSVERKRIEEEASNI